VLYKGFVGLEVRRLGLDRRFARIEGVFNIKFS